MIRMTAIVFCAVVIAVSTSGGDEVKVKPLKSDFPKANLEVVGSGSGVIVGPRYVLTNRHVVEDDSGNVGVGFGILLPPNYKTRCNARAVFICEEYDLALLQTSQDMEANELLVLEVLPPLGTKVTAFGFPHGDQFGIGLTVTGGQITRHPVELTEGNPSEVRIAKSVWHDAITAAGSSGGPLFGERGVLVGVHYGAFKAARGQALSVPATAVASFLRQTDAAKSVKFLGVNAAAEAQVKYDPAKLTVYIEIFSDGKRPGPSPTNGINKSLVRAEIEKKIVANFPRLSSQQLQELREGKLGDAFTPTPASGIESGAIVYIRGKMTLIQIIDNEGFLVRIDGVLCQIQIPGASGAEFRAKFGTDTVPDLSIDQVFVVGDATNYTTVAGKTGSYFPLTKALPFVDLGELASLIDKELSSREVSRLARLEAQQRADDARAAAAMAEAKKKLRHTFKDASGGFSVDAILVKVDGHTQTVNLLRIDTGKIITVDLNKLSDDDRRWITPRVTVVRAHGAEIAGEAKGGQQSAPVDLLPKDR